MRFDPFSIFSRRRLRDLREEREAAERYRRIVCAPLSPETRARMLAHRPTAWKCPLHGSEPIDSPCRVAQTEDGAS
jgi:hypothetical protein